MAGGGRDGDTDGQTTVNQERELREVAERHGWNVVAVHRDHAVSGRNGREKRPGLDRLLHAVSRREVDVVAAWSVDRLGRSLVHLLAILGELHAKGVDLYLHQQGVDTSTPAGKALFQMMGVFDRPSRPLDSHAVLEQLEDLPLRLMVHSGTPQLLALSHSAT